MANQAKSANVPPRLTGRGRAPIEAHPSDIDFDTTSFAVANVDGQSHQATPPILDWPRSTTEQVTASSWEMTRAPEVLNPSGIVPGTQSRTSARARRHRDEHLEGFFSSLDLDAQDRRGLIPPVSSHDDPSYPNGTDRLTHPPSLYRGQGRGGGSGSSTGAAWHWQQPRFDPPAVALQLEAQSRMRPPKIGGLSHKDRLGSIAESWGEEPEGARGGPVGGKVYGMFEIQEDPPSRSGSPFRDETWWDSLAPFDSRAPTSTSIIESTEFTPSMIGDQRAIASISNRSNLQVIKGREETEGKEQEAFASESAADLSLDTRKMTLTQIPHSTIDGNPKPDHEYTPSLFLREKRTVRRDVIRRATAEAWRIARAGTSYEVPLPTFNGVDKPNNSHGHDTHLSGRRQPVLEPRK